MAKQPSKPFRADSSAGASAAAVSSNTDAVAAAEPATPKVEATEPSVFADERTTLVADVRDMYDVAGQIIVGLEAYARTAAQDRRHAEHSEFSRLASVLGEFRAGLATVLNAPQV
jgi:hypothetical protein